MTIEVALLLSVVSVTCAVYFGVKSNKRDDTSDAVRQATETATINVKLDQIGGDVRDIKYDMTAVKKDVQNLTERVITLEQSTKSAHHRIDGVEEREKES
jgi:peptidoglycan hydrolase CwlO-like protein